MTITTTREIIDAMAQGEMVILVDDEQRENEGDLVLAADFASAATINFMAKYGRGLICLTLTPEHCERLQLPLMTQRNGTSLGTNFTVSIEAAQGVTTGISAADRAHTIRSAIAPTVKPSDLVSPGHIFPLRAQPGGVLVRAGHTEAGCDLAQLAGLTPASVICEIMNEDGTMARLPDLRAFAAQHQLKIGTIADLIEYRSQTESFIQQQGSRQIVTQHGIFQIHQFRDQITEQTHLALTCGDYQTHDSTLVRVHYPTTLIELINRSETLHSWSIDAALAQVAANGHGVVVLMHCTGQSTGVLPLPIPAQTDSALTLRTFGIGAQILRHLGVKRMTLLGAARKMPSLTGFGLDVVDFREPAQSEPVNH